MSLLVALGCALAYWALVGRFAPAYKADATILMSGSKFKLTLDPKFTTAEGLTNLQSGSAARSDEILAVTLSQDVYVAAAKNILNDGQPNAEAIANSITTMPIDASTRGTILTVRVTSNSAETAARVANAFAQAATDRLKVIYGLAEEDEANLRAKLSDAVANQEQSEAAYSSFLLDNHISELQRQITQKETVRQAIIDQQNRAAKDRLTRSSGVITDLIRLRSDAEALREQIRASGQSQASTVAQALGLLALESRFLSVSDPMIETTQTVDKDGKVVVSTTGRGSGVVGQLNLNIDQLSSGANRAQLASDIDALIVSIDRRQETSRAEYQAALTNLTRQVSQGERFLSGDSFGPADAAAGPTIDQLSNEIRSLEAQFERETRQKDNLAKQVEIATTLRNSLASKLQESVLANTGPSDGPIIIGRAQVPKTRTSPPSLLRLLPIAASIGLMVGIVVAIALDWRAGRQPSLRAARTAT